MTVHDHPTALALASLRGHTAAAATAREHLERCVACRVRAARLQHAGEVDEPSDSSVRRILAASSPGPSILRNLLTTPGEANPRPGQLWRVGREEALLVLGPSCPGWRDRRDSGRN
jgi:hypothetical protein